MVKKIIWSKKAQKDRLSILTYWNNRNKPTAKNSINYLRSQPNYYADTQI